MGSPDIDPKVGLAIGKAWVWQRQRVLRLWSWAFRERACRSGLEIIEVSATPEQALRTGAGGPVHAPAWVAQVLGCDGLINQADDSVQQGLHEADLVIASPEWAALFDGVRHG